MFIGYCASVEIDGELLGDCLRAQKLRRKTAGVVTDAPRSLNGFTKKAPYRAASLNELVSETGKRYNSHGDRKRSTANVFARLLC